MLEFAILPLFLVSGFLLRGGGYNLLIFTIGFELTYVQEKVMHGADPIISVQ